MDTGPSAAAGPAGACSPHLAAAASILHNFLLLQQQQPQISGGTTFGTMSEQQQQQQQKLSSPTGSAFAPSATLSPAHSHPTPTEGGAAAFGSMFAGGHGSDVAHNNKQDPAAVLQQLQQELKSEKDPRVAHSGWPVAAEESFGRPQSLGCLGWLAAVGEGREGAAVAPPQPQSAGATRSHTSASAEPSAVPNPNVGPSPSVFRNRSLADERSATQSSAVVRPWSNSPVAFGGGAGAPQTSAPAASTRTPQDGSQSHKRSAQQQSGGSDSSRHKLGRRNDADVASATRLPPHQPVVLVESGTQTCAPQEATAGGQELHAMENMCAKLQDLFNRTLQQLRNLEQRRILQKCTLQFIIDSR